MRIDLHVHTRRHSPCSSIEPADVVPAAIRAGLNGVVITEHEYQWSGEELQTLRDESGMPGFLVLAGFEYRTVCGDLLVYGLQDDEFKTFTPGMAAREATELAKALGGVCIAAHPTREGMGFDRAIAGIPLAAIEVCSVNLTQHERRLAVNLANALDIRPVAASDAHAVGDVGRYATGCDRVISSMAELQKALQDGRFRVTEAVYAELGIS